MTESTAKDFAFAPYGVASNDDKEASAKPLPSDGYFISLYWLLLGRRIAEIKSAVDGGTVKLDLAEARWLSKLFDRCEVARYENTVLYIPVDDMARLHRMIPNLEPRQPMKPSEMPIPQPKPIEQKTPFVSGGVPVEAVPAEPEGAKVIPIFPLPETSA